MEAFRVSQFNLKKNKAILTDEMMQQEYQFLERLYYIKEVEQQKVYAKEYAGRNRYVDIITYRKTRVKLENGVNLKKKPDGDYINACYINSPFIVENQGEITGDTKIIASQGPLPETTDHFWQMIVENNVTMIVSTCKLEEQGRAKCNQFWPKKTEAQFNVSQDDKNPEYIKVNLLDTIQESSFLNRREMQVAKADGSTQRVTQIHFTCWPDHGVPVGQASLEFEHMLNKFIEWNLKSANNERAIVHCSAGIGRTGTTISLMEAIIQISAQRNAGIKDPQFSLFHIVRRLREQRWGSVQTFS